MFLTTNPQDPIWGGLYFAQFNTPLEDPTSYLPTCNEFLFTPCVPNPFFQPECATDDPATQSKLQYTRYRMYPIAPLAGGGADVGLISEMQINLVAFGSIPATATLELRAPRVGGAVQPFQIHSWDDTGDPTGFGCDPSFRSPVPTITLVNGQVEIRLSDLKIDGAPVDLGPACRTESPSELNLWADLESGSYAPGSGGPLAARDGLMPAALFPLDHPLYYEDNGLQIQASSGIDIAAFTGCGTNGEDLDGIVTAMASGPNNPVSLIQGPLVAATGTIPLEDLTQCVPQIGETPPVCPLPGPPAPPMPPLPNGEMP